MTTERVLIRDARDADRPRLVAFMAALQEFERATEPNRTPGPEMAESHIDALIGWAGEHPGGSVLVAEMGSRVAGFLITGVKEELGTYVPEPARLVGDLSDLWVEPEFRGRGVARALVAEAEARLRATGIARVEVSALPTNADALALYRRLGYADCLVTLERDLRHGT